MIQCHKSKQILNESVPFHKILHFFNRHPSISIAAASVSLIHSAPISDPISENFNQFSSIKLAQVLASYARKPLMAYFLFKDSQALGFHHDLSTYSVIIRILCRSGMHSKLLSLFSLACLLKGIAVGIGDILCLIHSSRLMLLVTSPRRLFFAFYQLCKLGFIPSVRTCNFLLNHVVENFELEMIMVVFDQMKRFGVSPDTYMLTIMIKAFCRGKKLDEAYSVWERMEENGVKPDLITHNTYMIGLCDHCGPDTDFSLLRQIISQGVPVDSVVYNIVNCGFCKDKKLREAEEVLQHMATHNVTPDADSYRNLIKGYCDDGNLKRALDLHEEWN